MVKAIFRFFSLSVINEWWSRKFTVIVSFPFFFFTAFLLSCIRVILAGR
jgi:hypothetical protein